MAIITISRGSMSGGEALAQCLSTTLDYPIVARDVLVAAAKKLDVSEETLTKKIVRGPGVWESLTSNRRLYVVAVQAALAEHLDKGNLVYHGHAGHLLLKGVPTVLRVRLIAPLEMRVRSVMERQHLNREAAVEYITKVDHERIRWTQFIYGVDWSDPSIYDLVINLENMSIQTACATIAAIVRQPEFALTNAAKKAIADFQLACRVKIALATNALTRELDLHLKADNGTVEISAEVPKVGLLTHTSSRDEREILRVVQGVEGVKQVYLDLQEINPYPYEQ
ncbi:MAG: cytidylate kinase family protein [Candidatus Binatia bacterium]|jgi:cytidylate kinase